MIEEKNILAMPGSCSEASCQDLKACFPAPATSRLSGLLQKIVRFLKPEIKRLDPADPALAVIDQLKDPQLRRIVKELHYLTPPSLKMMREECPQCFFLPEDCPYVDYSIPDVKKAVKRINAHPLFSFDPLKVIVGLEKVNTELAFHLREHYDLDE